MPTGAAQILYLPGTALPAAGRATNWLVAAELAELALVGDERRRGEWLAGRWAAKQLLVRAGIAHRAAGVEICSRDAQRRGSRPQVRVAGQPLAGSLSIAHTVKGVLVALVTDGRRTVGVDLVDLAEVARLVADGRGRGFARLWFTPLERCWIAADRAKRTATLWGIKEAVYKACQLGEGWAPRDVVVWPRAAGGFRCQYRGRAIDGLHLEVSQIDGQVTVLASVNDPAEQTKAFRDSLQHEFILGQAS
ncbi:MAG TPA: 4'-phosphopantetheinyl transferase superfamily protein [Pirellulales bacterium]|jgi:phosphopantetheinyl transferase (holo-ACP synthase)|nr:4'-phosphopantetheinyl transferase superfamily protein [Pirellulales bacterium]